MYKTTQEKKMKFTEFLNEVEAKDWQRMQALIDKNKDGASVAKSIKDKTKAIDRYVAGLRLTETELTKPPFKGTFSDFGNRAIELGATYDEIKKAYDNANIEDVSKPKEEEEEWVPKTRLSDKPTEKVDHRRPAAILSIGNINLKTGYSKYFNAYEVWGAEESIYELWKLDNNKYRIVITAGKTPTADIGDSSLFKGDQSGRNLGGGTLVDWAVGIDAKRMSKKYGTTFPAFVYK